MSKHIHPVFENMLSRQAKEKFLNQRALVVWLTGLSGSGKSTIANKVEQLLHKKGILTALLDGDNLRTGLNANLGFTSADREENIRRVAETAKLFLNNGLVVLCSFVSPTQRIRARAASIIGKADFLEVWVNASFEVCAQRDVKGLYKKALAGEIKNFTGLDAPFEAPKAPFMVLDTAQQTIEESASKLVDALLKKIKK